MELNLNIIKEKINQNEYVQNFVNELKKSIEIHNKSEIELEGNNMNDIKLTDTEELEFDRKEFIFLQNCFKKELSDKGKGEPYIVTNKYENDTEYHRYKVAQYKDNLECKYIALEKDLPKNVQIGDVVRKINGVYIYDEQATRIYKIFFK